MSSSTTVIVSAPPAVYPLPDEMVNTKGVFAPLLLGGFVTDSNCGCLLPAGNVTVPVVQPPISAELPDVRLTVTVKLAAGAALIKTGMRNGELPQFSRMVNAVTGN